MRSKRNVILIVAALLVAAFITTTASAAPRSRPVVRGAKFAPGHVARLAGPGSSRPYTLRVDDHPLKPLLISGSECAARFVYRDAEVYVDSCGATAKVYAGASQREHRLGIRWP